MLRQKVGRLKGMAVRNAKDKVMASQVSSGPAHGYGYLAHGYGFVLHVAKMLLKRSSACM